MAADSARAETRYTRSEAGYVAYQLFGRGTRATMLVPSWLQNLDVMWEEPSLARYLGRLGSFSRVICFDKRGSGVSDPVQLSALPTIEEWMDDARAAQDAAGIDQVTLIGDTEGGPMALVYAASYPDRVAGLVLVNSFARWRRADDYPIGMPTATWERLVSRYEQVWGANAEILDFTAPSRANDPQFRAWFTRYQRLAMPPGAASTMYRWVTSLDVRSVLPAIRVPTLIVHRSANRHHRVEFGRYLADQIPAARFVELPGGGARGSSSPSVASVTSRAFRGAGRSSRRSRCRDRRLDQGLTQRCTTISDPARCAERSAYRGAETTCRAAAAARSGSPATTTNTASPRPTRLSCSSGA